MIKDFYTEDSKEIRSAVLARRIAEIKRQWKKEGAANAEGKMAKLMGLLVKEGRIDDITKASENSTYRKQLLEEFQLN